MQMKAVLSLGSTQNLTPLIVRIFQQAKGKRSGGVHVHLLILITTNEQYNHSTQFLTRASFIVSWPDSIGVLPLKKLSNIEKNTILQKQAVKIIRKLHQLWRHNTCKSSYSVISCDCAGVREVGRGGKMAACNEG